MGKVQRQSEGAIVEIDRSKSFRYNYEQGVPKDVLMKYYVIESEEKWDKIMAQIKDTKLREDAKKFSTGKEKK